MQEYKIGDINENGYEVVDVYHRVVYKLRKRIRILTDWHNMSGILAWYYFEGPHSWIETDDGKQFKLRSTEFEFVDVNQKV